MKFKEEQRLGILKFIDAHGLDKDDFTFIKRKGRIIIKYKSASTFSFYKREHFDIDMETRERLDLSEYEIKLLHKETQFVRLWSDVLSIFSTWLDELETNTEL